MQQSSKNGSCIVKYELIFLSIAVFFYGYQKMKKFFLSNTVIVYYHKNDGLIHQSKNRK